MYILAKEFSLYKWEHRSNKSSPGSHLQALLPPPPPPSAIAIVLETLSARTSTHVHMSSFYISYIRPYTLGGILIFHLIYLGGYSTSVHTGLPDSFLRLHSVLVWMSHDLFIQFPVTRHLNYFQSLLL